MCSPEPKAPDPGKAAAVQGAVNVDTAEAQNFLNMTEVEGPYGTTTYNPTGNSMVVGSGDDARVLEQFRQTTELAPAQQQMLDLTNAAGIKYGETANEQLGQVASTLSNPLDFGSLGAAPQMNEDTRAATADALYQRMQPQFDRDQAALDTRLANQGIAIGSEAYGSAQDDIGRQRTDARLAVEDRALAQAQGLYGMESDQRDQAISEMLAKRSVPLNELAAMLTGAQVQVPGSPQTPQASLQAPDITGSTYASYAGQNAANTAQTQGLYGLLGTGAMAGALAFGRRR